MNTTQFRKDLLTAMSRKGIKQIALAAMSGVSQPNLSKFLRGKKGISGDDLLALWPFAYGEGISPPTESTNCCETEGVTNHHR